MKRKVVILLCAVMFVCGCSGDKKEEKTDSETPVELIEQSDRDEMENNDSFVEGVPEVKEEVENFEKTIVESPFGYQFDSGDQELFRLKIPSTWYFSTGSSQQGEHVIDDKKSGVELSAEAESLQLDYALFSAAEDFNGTVSISSYYNGNDFTVTKDAWLGALNSRLSEETLKESSGEKDGYQWTEMYWTKGGNYEYHLLMDMNGEMAFVFDVSGAEKSEMNDFEKLHLYFMDGIIRTN